MNYYGSICLSDIAATGQAKKASNGKIYLNISIRERREVGERGDTHYITCAPKKDERVDGVNYIVGNIKPSEWERQPSPEDIANAPSADLSELIF